MTKGTIVHSIKTMLNEPMKRAEIQNLIGQKTISCQFSDVKKITEKRDMSSESKKTV